MGRECWVGPGRKLQFPSHCHSAVPDCQQPQQIPVIFRAAGYNLHHVQRAKVPPGIPVRGACDGLSAGLCSSLFLSNLHTIANEMWVGVSPRGAEARVPIAQPQHYGGLLLQIILAHVEIGPESESCHKMPGKRQKCCYCHGLIMHSHYLLLPLWMGE